MGYSDVEKHDVIHLYYSNNSNTLLVQRQFRQLFPGRRVPCKNTIKNIVKLFKETKSVKRKPRKVERNEDEDLAVLLYFEGIFNYIIYNIYSNTVFVFIIENPEASTYNAARILNMSRKKIITVLKFYKYHPFRFLPVQDLTADHRLQRINFCREILRRLDENADFLNNIIFTDEATFTTAGIYNRRNKHHWATDNPRRIQPTKTQGRKAVHVWCGIIRNMIIGPIFLENYLNGERYLNLLRNEVEGQLEELPILQYNNLIWQQDGAPPHNNQQVTAYLNEKYNFWIGRHGTLRWPANSPDLTPPDNFLWGYLKNKVYYDQPQNIQILKARIREEINIINTLKQHFIVDTINRKLIENIRRCVVQQGGHVEQL